MSKLAILKCIVALTVLFISQFAHAFTIELLGTYQQEKGSAFKSIRAIAVAENNQIYALDGRNGVLININLDENSLSPIPLLDIKTEESIFSSKQFSGLSLDGDDSLYLINTANNVVAKFAISEQNLERRFGEKGSKPGMLNKAGQIALSVNDRLYIANRTAVSVFSPNGAFLYDIGNDSNDATLNFIDVKQIAIDRRERIYTLGKDSRISMHSYTGELIARLNEEQLIELLAINKVEIGAITVDPYGNLFVAENNSGKIYHIDLIANKIVNSFGSQGDGPGQYREITALAINAKNQLAVADSKNAKLDVYQLSFDRDVNVKREWLPNVGDVAFTNVTCTRAYRLNNQEILCLDSKTGITKHLSADGTNEIKTFDLPVKGAEHAAFDDTHVAVLGNDVIGVYDLATGKQKTLFGKNGEKDGELGRASDIAIYDRKIYVTENLNNRVQVFTLNGVHLRKIPADANDKRTLPNPFAVAIDSNGYVYVADQQKAKIMVFNDEDRLIYELGIDRPSPASFQVYRDMIFDKDNNLYILVQTPANPSTIIVYSGQKKIFQMGSASKTNRYAMYGAKTISVSPSDKTLISVYNVGGVSLFSKDKSAVGMLDYNYLQVPLPVTDLKIEGSVTQTKLQWQKASANFVQQYQILGSDNADSGFEVLTTTTDASITIEHAEGKSKQFYKIAAVSGFGVIGPESFPQKNTFQEAYLAYKNDEYDKSIGLLQTIVTENPADVNAVRYLGLNYSALENYKTAAQYYGQLAKLPGYEVEGMNLQIEALFINKDYVDAMAIVTDLMQLSDDNESSQLNCGRLSMKMGDAIGAVECLENLLVNQPDHPEANILLGEAYAQVGAVEQGIIQLQQATSINSDNVDVWITSGDILFDLDRVDLAKANYESALQLDANNTLAQLGLAKAALELEDAALTKNIAIKLAGKKETASTGNYLLGLLAYKDEDYGPALLSVSKATRADKTNVDAWLLLAETHTSMENQDRAIKALASAVEADPASFQAAKQYGLVLVQQEEFEEAAIQLNRAATLNPNDFETQMGLTQAWFGADRLVQAINSGKKAIELENENPAAYELTAAVARKRGKVGEAIEFLKEAIELVPEKFENHQSLGDLYAENNLYPQASAAYEKAIVVNAQSTLPHIALGKLYAKQRNFDEAIKSFQQAVEIDPIPENTVLLDETIAAQKAALEFDNGAPQIVLKNLQLNNVFSAAYKQYIDNPLGQVEIANVSGIDYANLEIELNIKGYMDFPTKQTVESLAANSSQTIDLFATFNNKMLTIDEDTGVQIEVRANYLRDGQKGSINVTQPMTVYGKNALVWNNINMIGSFATPKDDSLRDFTRRTLNEYKPERGPLSENLINAMTIFDSLSAYGMRYVLDPNNPFPDLSKDQIDYVQFSRETLRLRSGDCDDLSVLLISSLENLGIETALLDIPGHVFMMFNTGLPSSQRELITSNPELVVDYNGSIWVPLEATMIATTFTEAWAEGAKKFYDSQAQGELNIIEMQTAWANFQPVTLPPSPYEFELPAKEQVQTALRQQRDLLIERSLERLVKPYKVMLQIDPENQSAKMQVAITYGKYGLYQQALNAFDSLLEDGDNLSSIHNNKGNVYFNRTDYQRAFESYSQAEQLDKNDAGVKINLAMALYKSGDAISAADKFQEAVVLDEALTQEFDAFGKLLFN